MYVVCVKFRGLLWDPSYDDEENGNGWLNTEKLTHELDSFEVCFDRDVIDDEHDMVNCAGLEVECFELICF
jgi:hypothetical protein